MDVLNDAEETEPACQIMDFLNDSEDTQPALELPNWTEGDHVLHINDLPREMLAKVLKQLDDVTQCRMKRVCWTWKSVLDGECKSKNVTINFDVLSELRNRRPKGLLWREREQYWHIAPKIAAYKKAGDRRPGYFWNYQLHAQVAMDRLDVGAVLQKLQSEEHENIHLCKPSGPSPADELNYDFRDWNWLHDTWYVNCTAGDLDILLEGITIDLEVLAELLVDAVDSDGDFIFSRIRLRNVCVVGGLSAKIWGMSKETRVYLHIDDLEIRKSDDDKGDAQRVYNYMRDKFLKPMDQEKQNDMMGLMGTRLVSRYNPEEILQKIYEECVRKSYFGDGVRALSDNFDGWKKCFETAPDYVKWSTYGLLAHLRADHGSGSLISPDHVNAAALFGRWFRLDQKP